MKTYLLIFERNSSGLRRRIELFTVQGVFYWSYVGESNVHGGKTKFLTNAIKLIEEGCDGKVIASEEINPWRPGQTI